MARTLPVLLFFSIFCLCTRPVLAQGVITGKVTDVSTGEPLPAANVVIEGTFSGTITNEDGHYALRVDHFPATLIFRYIGYATRQFTLNQDADRPLDVALEPVAYELGEVVVTGEDPAIAIMRRVIERKQVWRQALETFEAEAYTRFTLANDTGIVSIVESLSSVFWDNDRGMKEIVRSKRQTANVQFDEFLPAAHFVSNLYDDDIEISGYNFIGVTHPDALDHYHFRLKGTRRIDDQTVYDISVESKSRFATAFVGEVAVLDSVYALLDVALRPGEAFLFPPPIREYNVTFFQQFSSFGQAFWLPVDFRSDMELKIDFQGLLTFPAFKIRQVSRLTEYQVNVPVPDSLFKQEEYLVVDSAAVEADTLLDRGGAVVPLETREVRAYETIDSTRTLAEAYQPSGPLAHLARIQTDDNEDSDENDGTGGRIFGIDLKPKLWFNRVEGVHGSLHGSRNIGRLRIQAGGGWSSELEPNRNISGLFSAVLRTGPRERGLLALSYEFGTDTRYRSRYYTRPVTSVYLLLSGNDYFDYYWRRKLKARVEYRFASLPATTSAAFTKEWPDGLEANTGYYLFGRHDILPPNPAVPPLDLTSGTLRLVIGQDVTTLGITGRRYASLEVERGVTHAEENIWFTRYALDAEWSMPTFLRRRLLPAMLYIHLTAGTSEDKLPLQRYGTIDGRLGPYSPFGTLRTRTGRPYEGDTYLGIFWEHHFRTIPFEMLGLYGLAKRGYGIILHGGHARTWLSGDNFFSEAEAQVGSIPFHHEIGASINGIFGLFRLDVTKRIDAPGMTVGFAAARLF